MCNGYSENEFEIHLYGFESTTSADICWIFSLVAVTSLLFLSSSSRSSSAILLRKLSTSSIFQWENN